MIRKDKLVRWTKICRGGGQNYRNIVFFLFLFASFSSLFSQDRNQSSLYLGTIELGSGITKDREAKIRNGITINLIRNYKDKFRIIDDETVKNLLGRLKIQQQTGCSTEKCERMIDDALNADFKITGSLSFETSKLQLTLKLFRFRDLEPSLENQVVRTFTQSQFEYYIAELTSALVDSRYTINDKDAPSEIELGKVDLSKISIKEVAGSDLKVIEFKKSDDSEVNEITNQIKPFLAKGDGLFKEKNYGEALVRYNSILKNINKSENPSKFAGLKDTIIKRIEQCNTNIYSAKIKEVDTKLSKYKDLSKEEAEEFVLTYDDIRKEYGNLIIGKSNEIFIGLDERIEKIDISNYINQEKSGDTYYENYKFTSAIGEYNNILEKVNNKPKTKSYLEYRERLQKKIATTRSTGTSFIKNKFSTYLEIARRRNIILGQNKDYKNEEEALKIEQVIRDSLQGARTFLLGSEFVDESMLGEFNKVLNKLNQDNAEYKIYFGDPLETRDLKSNLRSENREEISYFEFPGRTQFIADNKEFARPTLKSSILYYGAWTSVAIIGLGYLGQEYYYKRYDEMAGDGKKLSPVTYYLFPELFPFFLLSNASEQPKYNSLYEKVETSTSLMNTGFELFGVFYVASLLDLKFQKEKKEELIGRNAIPLFQMEKGSIGINAGFKPIFTQRAGMREMQYTLEYSYQF